MLEKEYHTGPIHDSHVIGGHKGNLHNPNTSEQSKEHSKAVLEDDFGLAGAYDSPSDGKDPGRV